MVKELNMLSKVSMEMIESFLSKNQITHRQEPYEATVILCDEMSKSQDTLLHIMTIIMDGLFDDESDKLRAIWGVTMTWKLLLQAAEVEELEKQL